MEYYEKICKTITEGISKKKDEIRQAYINKYSPKNIWVNKKYNYIFL